MTITNGWSAEEIATLTEKWGVFRAADIAPLVHKTPNAVIGYAPPVVIKPLKEPRTRRSPAVVTLAVAAANDDPAARAAEALLSNARSAETRRDGYRSGFGRTGGRK